MVSSRRRRSSRFVALSLAASLAAPLAQDARAQTLQPGFTLEEIGIGWDRPTCIVFADAANMLVAEKGGMVWNVRNGVKRLAPVLDLRAEVLDNGDRGLLTIQVDPEWSENGYLYLGYIVDPNGDNNEAEQESFGRITRYTLAKDAGGDLVADPASRKILIGPSWTSGIPSLHYSHSIGDMRFAADGSLFITTGDGAHYDVTDAGGFDPNGFGTGKFDASEDIGAFRSQSLTSLAGKVLRVDPSNGTGLASNPYWTGNPWANQSRVWATGLRNPFRFCLRPGTGMPERLYIGDVGWNTFEEINHAARLAENFGWPCYEGPRVESSYDNADPISACNDPTVFTKPLWGIHHSVPGNPGFTMQCVAGMQVYGGTDYPQKYQGRLFFCEYSSNFIRTVRFVNGQPTEVELFASVIGNPVDLIAHPENGDLVYIGIGLNLIRRIRYTNADGPPEIVATATPYFGPSPLTVTLDASATTDPEGQPLSFAWDFGDGTTGTNAVETHVYPNGVDYTAKLVVTDAAGQTDTWTRKISVDNTPPTAPVVTSPPTPAYFTDGQAINFACTATDAEDNAAGFPVAVEWKLDLVHDHHVHPAWHVFTGATTSWTAESEGEGTYWHVTVTATDSRGLKAQSQFDLFDLSAEPHAHLLSVSDVAPRVGVAIEARAHVHYAGMGPTELRFDWGDGTRTVFQPSHLQDRNPSHLYAAPGLYTLRVSAGDDPAHEPVTQVIQVRPLHPGVAIFAPVGAGKWIGEDEQWSIASELATGLRSVGFEAEIFSYGSQDGLATWMGRYQNDAIRDYVVVLDLGAEALYAGQDDGSLAEDWIEHGNGLLWTGYAPFAWYLNREGKLSNAGAGDFAADEVLDAAIGGVCNGVGAMQLLPPAVDLPDLAAFSATRAAVIANLGAGWNEEVVYADDGSTGPGRCSDAAVFRNAAGGEYAQFLCLNNDNLPRDGVLLDFLLTHLFAGRPAGPNGFDLQHPFFDATDVKPLQVLFDWEDDGSATSWLFELSLDPAFSNVVETATVTGAARYAMPRPLRQSTPYWWRVTARNDYGSVLSRPSRFTTGRGMKPAK